MSAFLLGAGFRADMGTCIRKLVLLKLIDACEDDGSRIFPAIATVAKAAQCSDRQVQRELKAFLSIGLLSLVRAGGQGRRSTNEYALDLDVLSAISKAGWDAYAESSEHNNTDEFKGDTQSPLNGDAKGDRTGPDRVTPETAKGDNGSPPTPTDPSLDPSIERERGREGREDTKRIDAEGWALLKDWPGFAGMPKEPALKMWHHLSVQDRADAARMFPHWLALLKAQSKTHTPAPSTYFRLRLWAEVPEPAEAAAPTVVLAPPFGPMWMAGRIAGLLAGPTVRAHLTSFERSMVETGRMSEADLAREKQVKSGYPAINAMHERAAHRQGTTVAAALQHLAGLMEPVPVGSTIFEDWRSAHEEQGWPWLPDPGALRVVYFPAGGPVSGIEAAVQALNEAKGNDGDEREAAE
ncbi:hypothetical protein GA830_12120 [Mesorhizobium sp. NBSH29]|uniref:hypothetical protein n=1 Tax=Mesorhizobium sp. NBSH29 TaxID=2654249 RepID=UPI0018967B07|nr:hypothetical protein [Mesorhizobium sp. NBSH29]QPC87403.1 hypothetical protein GA830_12120 [Mesorhizobium sp. NBSH29]